MTTRASRVEAILGGSELLPTRLSSFMSYVQVARIGLTRQNFESLRTYTALDVSTLADILAITPRTVQRKTEGDRFKSTTSEKMLELAHLYARGYEVFGDQSAFQAWMRCPNRALGGSEPLNMVDTGYGLGLVEDELGRIEHGVIS